MMDIEPQKREEAAAAREELQRGLEESREHLPMAIDSGNMLAAERLNTNLGFSIQRFQKVIAECLCTLPDGREVFLGDYLGLQELAEANSFDIATIAQGIRSLEERRITEFSFRSVNWHTTSPVGALRQMSLSGISHMTELRSLSLLGNSSVIGFDEIAKLKQLEKLFARGVHNLAEGDISQLTGLKHLILGDVTRGTPKFDYDSLRSMTELESLRISFAPLESLEELPIFPELQELAFHDCNVRDLFPLLRYPKLCRVYAQSNPLSEESRTSIVQELARKNCTVRF